MKILHIAPLTLKKSAGLTYSIPNFVQAQNSIQGVESKILVSIKPSKRKAIFKYIDEFESKKEMKYFLNQFDIAVFHSTYILRHIQIARILKNNNIPYIIVPRGGFTKKSMNIKPIKKVIANFFGFKRYFTSSNAIHYLTKNEKNSSYYKDQYNFILPNGIHLNENNIFKQNKRSHIEFTFIGRKSIYHKGLDLLIEAINLVNKNYQSNTVRINIYGSGTEKSNKELQKMINKFNLSNFIFLYDAVYREEKKKVLLNSDVFIQTSRFEGLPMGILEALSFGIPCILTPGTNLADEIDLFSAGISVKANSQSIANGIISILEGNYSLNDISENAYKLAKQFSWNKIAKKSIEEYKDIIDSN